MQKTTTALARWGNSLGVRLPQGVAKSAGLREGDRVDVSLEGNAVIMRRAKPHYTLDQLLASMTPGNVHPETDWGEPVGRERFWEDE
jgi:antitoxin MazE